MEKGPEREKRERERGKGDGREEFYSLKPSRIRQPIMLKVSILLD